VCYFGKKNGQYDQGKNMKGRAAFAGLFLVGGVVALAYLLASGRPLNHEITFLAVLAGFVICDRSFWPGSNS